MLDFGDLNWLAILLMTLVSFAIGGLWYGPVFGKAWLVALGKTQEQLPATAMPFVINFFTSLLTSIVLAGLIDTLGFTSLGQGAMLGLIVGVGLIFTASAGDAAFCGFSANLVWIQTGYRVLYCVVTGAVLAWWQ